MSKVSKKPAAKPTKAPARRTAKAKETITFLGKTYEKRRAYLHGVSRFARGNSSVEVVAYGTVDIDAYIAVPRKGWLPHKFRGTGRTQAKALAQLETMVAFVRGFGK